MQPAEVVQLMAGAFAAGVFVGARVVPWAVNRLHGWR